MALKAKDVAAFLESLAPLESGVPGDDLGFSFGDPETQVSAVAVCWAPTRAVIAKAAAGGANLLVAHEPLFHRRAWSGDGEVGARWFDEAPDADKLVNRRRAALLARHRIAVYRAHSNWDTAPGIGVGDALAAALGLGAPLRRRRFTAVYRVPPLTVGALACRVRRRLATGPIRCTGSPGRLVSHVGLFYGGLGQMFNVPEEMVALGAEAAVAGECLAYTLHHAAEIGLAVIEAGHCASENPGMRAMAGRLGEAFATTPVFFLDSGRPWRFPSAAGPAASPRRPRP